MIIAGRFSLANGDAREQQRQSDPDDAPTERLPVGDLVRPAIEQAQIDGEHDEDEGRKAHPEPQGFVHGRKI